MLLRRASDLDQNDLVVFVKEMFALERKTTLVMKLVHAEPSFRSSEWLLVTGTNVPENLTFWRQ